MSNQGWRRPETAGPIALVVVLSLVVVLFVCGGGALALYLIDGHSGTAAAQSAAAQSAAARSAASPSGSAASGKPAPAKGSGSAAPTASPVNPAAIVKGECVVNDGTQDLPKLRLAACAPGVFLVVGRFEGTDDVHRCDAVPGATHNFFYRTDPVSLSFVLCLKRQ
jgi:hypothetical protein